MLTANYLKGAGCFAKVYTQAQLSSCHTVEADTVQLMTAYKLTRQPQEELH